MEAGYQQCNNGHDCCANWWGALTPVQKMWLHSHLWDLEILEGWTSDIIVNAVKSHHSQRVQRYSPAYTNGSIEGA